MVRLFLILLALLLAGCGGGDDARSAMPLPEQAGLRILHSGGAPLGASSLRVVALDGRGQVLVDTGARPFADTVVVPDVPRRASRLHLEYRDGDRLLGLATEPLNLPSEVRDPPVQSLATLASLALDVEAERLPLGFPARARALATFADGSTLDVTPSVAWSAPASLRLDEGVLEGLRNGRARVEASLAGHVASLDLEVTSARAVALLPTVERVEAAVGVPTPLSARVLFDDGAALEALALEGEGPGITLDGGRVTADRPGRSVLALRARGQEAQVSVVASAARVAGLEVGPAPAPLLVGRPARWTATAVLADGLRVDVTEAAAWSAEGALVASDGTLVARFPGPVSATATWGGATSSATAQARSVRLQRLEVTAGASEVPAGVGVPVQAVAWFSDGTVVDVTRAAAWTSDDPAALGVAPGADGVLRLRGLGGGTVTARLEGEAGAGTVGILTNTFPIWIRFEDRQPKLAVGTRLPVRISLGYDNGAVYDMTGQVPVTVAQPALAGTVNAGDLVGTVQGLAPGATTLSVTYTYSNTVTDQVPLEVLDATVAEVSVTPPSVSMAAGSFRALTATALLSDGTLQDLTRSVTWTSADRSVATVAAAGLAAGTVTAQGPGSAQVGASWQGLRADASVTVSAATIASLHLRPQLVLLGPGESVDMSASGRLTDGATVLATQQLTWSSSDSSVFTVSNADGTRGRVVGVAPGSATLKALDPQSGIWSSVSVQVSGQALVSLALEPAELLLPQGRQQALIATGTYADGSRRDLTQAVGWSSSAASAAVSNTAGSRGVVTGVSPGSATLSARHVASGLSATATVEVTEGQPTRLDLEPGGALSLPAGFPLNLHAWGPFPGTGYREVTADVTWTSSDPAVAAVDHATPGLVRGLAPGTATLTARDPLSGLETAVPLTVTDTALVALSVSPSEPQVRRGAQTALQARASFADGTLLRLTEHVEWSSDAPGTFAMTAAGTGSALEPGTARVSAEYLPTGARGSTPVTVFDVERVGAFPTGRLTAMRFSPDGARLYALDHESDALLVLDPAAGRELGRFPAGVKPQGLDLTPDGRFALVASAASEYLSLVDLQALTVERIATLRPNNDVVVGADGRAWATDLDGYLQVVDLASRTVTSRSLVLKGASRLALDRGGQRLFVAEPELLRRYDVTSAPVLQETGIRSGPVRKIALTPDRLGVVLLAALGNRDLPLANSLGLFAAADFRLLRGIFSFATAPADVEFSADGRRLYALTDRLVVASVRDFRTLAQVDPEVPGSSLRLLAQSPDGEWLYLHASPTAGSGQIVRLRMVP